MIDVSIIIPVRNEEKYIAETINSLSSNLDSLTYELIVVDGMSTDNTRKIVLDLMKNNKNIILMDNLKKIVPNALNIAIEKSKGKFILRADSHSIFPKNYVSRLIAKLNEDDCIQNVGCICETIPSDNSRKSLAIAQAASSIFGVGNSNFRINKMSKNIIEVDTVPFGCFRRSLFDKIGKFDEDLIRNQDDEFNARIRINKGKIILLQDMKIKIFARKNFSSLFNMFYQYGLFKPLVNKKINQITSLRQLFPFINLILLSIGIIGSLIFKSILPLFLLIPYLFLVIFSSIIISVVSKRVDIILHILFSLITIHLSYGLGYSHGIINLFFVNKKYYDLEVNR